MKYQNVLLRSMGYELPPNVLSSDAIEERLAPVYERLKLPQGRLELMSGIKERRLWNNHTRPSEGAALAGQSAIDNSGLNPPDIQCLIFTSVSRDMMEPATASFVHSRLGLPDNCLIFDISNACLGFLDGMIMVANMIELGQIKHGLLVAGETCETLIDSTIEKMLGDATLTRKSIKNSFASLTIGSGAVAMTMSYGDFEDGGHKLIGGSFLANTAQVDLCQGGLTDSCDKESNPILMATDSEELLKHGVKTAHQAWDNFISELEVGAETFDVFFCHQVGRAHAKLLFETLGLDPERNFETLPYLGNVGSVSAPITMAIGIEQGFLSEGKRAAMLGIGSGINCLMLCIDW